MRPLLAPAGVTRLANITGLDHIGIPVVVSVRPNGRTLSQAAGTGVTLELATLSAAMESIELYHAEFASLPVVCKSYVELAQEYTVIPVEDLPLSRHSIFSPLTVERWTFGVNLLAPEARAARLVSSLDKNRAAGAPMQYPSGGALQGDVRRGQLQEPSGGRPVVDTRGGQRHDNAHGAPWDPAAREAIDAAMVAVPLDIVVLPRRTERVSESSLFSFQTTSNGLASGCAFIEALTVGLLEVIERDAVACCGVAARLGRATPRVRVESANNFPLAAELLDQLTNAGVHAIVYDCTVDTCVPVYRAVLYEAAERRVGLAEGWGAHLDAELALVRALTEAAQSRAVSIAGARDDRFGREIARARLTDSAARIAELEAQPPTVDLRASHAAPTFEADVETLLDRLVHVGVTQAIVVDLTLPAFGETLSVVRVIVPRLDGPGFDRGDPSPRAAAFAAGTRP
ncbi:MAG TPA: YcaO-like family protein [Chloroflexota bacterium]|nr:YcaO-like family protein [Chloroflexota bacterium]